MDNLSTYLISAPLSTLLTLLSGLSFATVFDYYGIKIFRRTEPSIRALYFFCGLLALGWLVWMVCLLKLATILFFKVLFWAIIIKAFFLIATKPARFTYHLPLSVFVLSNKTNTINYYFGWLLLLALVAFTLISMTVPTDADSMNYHLALPVDILHTGSLWFNKDMICFRMAGFGEMLNTLSLANGCPQLGGFLQLIAMLLVLKAFLYSIQPNQKTTLLAIFLGIPVLLFLLPNQKHQLTGILCTSICFFIISQQRHLLNRRVISLLITSLLFAAGIKYSFIISVGILLLFLAWKMKGEINMLSLVFKCLALASIILGPLFAFKWLYFGDPMSPFFERLKASPDPIVLKPFEYLRMFPESDIAFPLNLFYSAHFGTISMVLGIATLSILFCALQLKKYTAEILAIFSTTAFIGFTGQVSSRFFLEPVLWALPLIILSLNRLAWLKYYTLACKLQFLLLLPVIGFGLYSLGPSLLTSKLREKVMVQSSHGYAEAQWLDSVLPANARICIGNHSRAFLPRPFFPYEYVDFTDLNNKAEAAVLNKKLKEYQVNYLVMPTENYDDIIKKYAGSIFAGPKKFYVATRNPLNRIEYEMVIYKIK